MERKAKAATQTGIYLLLVAGILIVANLISFSQFVRWDLTHNERFTLSEGSAVLVRDGLKKDLKIDVYVTRGLPKYELFIQDLTDLLDEYERAGEGKLTYRLIEPKTDEEREKAKEAGLREDILAEGSQTGEDQATISRGFFGMVFKYGSEEAVIPIMSPESAQGLEFWITNKIREVRDIAEDSKTRIGIVTGKEELKLTDANLVAAQGGQGPNLKQIMEQALPFYVFEDVDLGAGENAINPELSGVIITQPGTDYTEKELRRIDEFLMLGNKAVVVFASAVNLKAADASMRATLSTKGLDKLLGPYGIEMRQDAVLDWGGSLQIPVQTPQGQALWFRAPGVVHVIADDRFEEDETLLDDSFAPFFRIPEIAMPFPSSLVPHPDKQPEAELKVVARSTPNATVDDAPSLDMKISSEWTPKGEYGQRVLAIAVEGNIKSAFPDAGDSGIDAADKSPEPSRVLVVASSQFLANPFARAGNPPPMPPQMAMMGQNFGGDQDLQMLAGPYANRFLTSTILALKNTLDWMSGDSTLLAASAKLLGEPNLTYADVEKPDYEPIDPNADPEEAEKEAQKRQDAYQAERKEVQSNVQWSLTFFAPLLFAAFGILRWRRRESKRDKIRI